MPTSLSLPHTLALSASFTPRPTAISACLTLSLCTPLCPFLISCTPFSQSIFFLSPHFLSFRFSIDPQSDPEALFRITPDAGLITTAMELDREREHWHNITVIATQRGQRSLFAQHLTLRSYYSLYLSSFLFFFK